MMNGQRDERQAVMANNDKHVLEYVQSEGSVAMVQLEQKPPAGLSPSDARASAQRLVSQGKLILNDELEFASPPTR
jgi:hypothetical protein